MTLPKKVTENDHGLWVLAVRSVRWEQRAAQEGGYAKIGPGVRRELDGRNVLRQIFAGGGEIPRPPARRDAFRAPQLPEDLQLRTRDANPPIVSALVDYKQIDHPFRAGVKDTDLPTVRR